MDKRGFEFSFAWIFAIVVGAVIIFLAIYSATKVVNNERTIQDTEIGKQIGILLNPIETNLEDTVSNKIIMPSDSRLINGCDIRGNFGKQEISIATRSGIGEEWQAPGIPSTFYNKYVFSASAVEGKEFIVVSKNFEMPYKVASVIYLWSSKDKYCFVTPPNYIEEDIDSLNLDGVNISSSKSNCPVGSQTVCFVETGCDIEVSLDLTDNERGSVKKKFSDSVHFEGSSLLYGAIFSDPGIYECQVKRLAKRTSELSGLYLEKSEYLTPKECSSSSLQPLLIDYSSSLLNIEDSFDLSEIKLKSDEIGRRNELLSCKLF